MAFEQRMDFFTESGFHDEKRRCLRSLHAGRTRVTPFKFPTLASIMTGAVGKRYQSKNGLPFLLVAMFTLQMLVPVVSASGMQSCSPLIGSGTCDSYDHNDDMTPQRQDWVEGSYVFDLVSTHRLNFN